VYISLSETTRKRLTHSLKTRQKKLTLLTGLTRKGKVGQKINGAKEISSYYQNF
jgi:hypothetical protein